MIESTDESIEQWRPLLTSGRVTLLGKATLNYRLGR